MLRVGTAFDYCTGSQMIQVDIQYTVNTGVKICVQFIDLGSFSTCMKFKICKVIIQKVKISNNTFLFLKHEENKGRLSLLLLTF